MQTLGFYTLFLQLMNDWDRDVDIIIVIVMLSLFWLLARYTPYHHPPPTTLSRSFVKHRTNPTDSSWSFKAVDNKFSHLYLFF